MKAILLLLQMMNISQKQPTQPQPLISPQPSPTIQLPQVGSQLAGMYGQKGNMYGQLAGIFRDMTMPKRKLS